MLPLLAQIWAQGREAETELGMIGGADNCGSTTRTERREGAHTREMLQEREGRLG